MEGILKKSEKIIKDKKSEKKLNRMKNSTCDLARNIIVENFSSTKCHLSLKYQK